MRRASQDLVVPQNHYPYRAFSFSGLMSSPERSAQAQAEDPDRIVPET